MNARPPLSRRLAFCILALVTVGLAVGTAVTGTLRAEESYRLPPPEIVALVDAPPAPGTSVSPDRRHMFLIEGTSQPSIEDVSRRMLRLAGVRIDPVANARFRTSYDRGLVLRDLRPGGAERRIPLPEGGKLVSVSWSHDSDHFVFQVLTADGTELWGARALDDAPPVRLVTGLNTVLGGPTWMPDGRAVVAHLVPEGRGPEPAPPAAPTGPNVQEATGTKTPLRTYQDLLSNPHDAALFEHYARSQLALVSFDGTVVKIGEPDLYQSASPSPNGTSLLVSRIERPFSYVHPYWSFPRTIEVWDAVGEDRRTLFRIPLEQDVPIGGVPTGPRSVQWHPRTSATLVFTEALDGGDPEAEVPHRDAWYTWAAPYEGEPTEIHRVEHRARGVSFLEEPNLVIFSEYDRDRRWTRSTLVDTEDPEKAVVLEDRSVRDRYGDPGSLQFVRTDEGERIVYRRGDHVFRTGSGASPDGVFPFLARQSLTSGESEVLWRSSEGSYETVLEVWHEGDTTTFITRHETPTSPPNLRLRTLDGEPLALTEFPDPTPQIRDVKKQVLTYEREDGVPLSATLYLPVDHREGDRLPLLVWAYPREYNDVRTAGQVGVSPYRFTRIGGSSHLHLVTQGYAIMDGATMPVIGDAETMNDTFIEQIVAAAQAAIDTAVEMGVADRDRVAVAGHSYGAFMTANLLAHCDLFRAGIARSGAYNRTLTPFGFQSERRTLWEAPGVYFGISPFMHADGIGEPILLIHGEADNNSGTYPLQSRRLFSAIQGNGGVARLVMLPNESHGYRARESILHCLAEMVDWLDTHVKNAEVAPTGFREGEERR